MHIQHPHKGVRRTKETFKKTLLSLMEEKKFHDITISELVKSANYNRGTFYAHYEKLEDLLDEVIEEMFEKMTTAYQKPYLELSVVNLSTLSPKSIVLFDHFLEHKTFYKIMLSSATNYNFREKLTQRLDYLFREDTELPVTEVDPELDITLFLTYRIHGVIGLILEWIVHDFRPSSSYMGDQLIHILRFSTQEIHIRKH